MCTIVTSYKSYGHIHRTDLVKGLVGTWETPQTYFLGRFNLIYISFDALTLLYFVTTRCLATASVPEWPCRGRAIERKKHEKGKRT